MVIYMHIFHKGQPGPSNVSAAEREHKGILDICRMNKGRLIYFTVYFFSFLFIYYMLLSGNEKILYLFLGFGTNKTSQQNNREDVCMFACMSE